MTAQGEPYLIVLGIAQDGGVPQAGTKEHRGWRDDALKRHVVCLAIVDPGSSKRWMIECTPDFREQLHMLDEAAPAEGIPGLDGIFLTHAHMGHYTGLMHLGHEAIGAHGVPVHAMPRMASYLKTNAPWAQLLQNSNIELRPLEDKVPVHLGAHLTVGPLLVPHRQECSEALGCYICGSKRSVLFIPDIDSWEDWDEQGTRIEELISRVDVAYLDGTFYTDDEVPDRDPSTFPHPSITLSMRRFSSLPPKERAKVRFIHLNHTNPALMAGSKARRTIEENGFRVAEEMERTEL